MTPSTEQIISTEKLEAYRPRQAAGFCPSRIVLAKGSNTTATRRRLLGYVRFSRN